MKKHTVLLVDERPSGGTEVPGLTAHTKGLENYFSGLERGRDAKHRNSQFCHVIEIRT